MDSIANILRDLGFRFNKQFGQNFITDNNLLSAMVDDSGICREDTVVEIGAGAGTLTRAIAAKCKKVYSFEIDRNLKEVLDITLAGLGNVEVVFRDIMKVSGEELREIVGGGSYKVVANLPYYITTPIIMRFLETEYMPDTLSIMVQKEVAERLVAEPGSADYGAISAAVALTARATITRIVGRNMFYPVPNVDSAVVRLDIDSDKYNCDRKMTKAVIKAAFAMRRKTLVNNLMQMGYPRARIEEVLSDLGIDVRVRGEVLGVEDFIAIAERLNEK